MSQEFGLAVRKPVSAWNKPLKVNFKDLFKALGKAGFGAATGQWMGVGKDTVDVMTAVGLDSDQPAELAWALIYNSLVSAIADLVSESKFLVQDVPEDLDQLCETLDLSLENLELEITDSFFEHPEQLSILKAIKIPLRQWLEGFWIEQAQAEALSNRLPSYFVFALHNEWRRNAQNYSKITDQVKTPFTEAQEREQGWRLYRAWLNKQIQEPMMFEAFGLADIYVPLRGYFRRKVAEESKATSDMHLQRPHDFQDKFERVVVDLETELKAWLQRAEKNDAIRVISGGPGSGKSSFVKILAARLANQGEVPVLFIPLHQFDPTGDLVEAVSEFIRYDQYFRDNPLNPDDANLKLFVIFDGLDELAMQGKIAKEAAQEFVREVQSTVSNFNRHKTRLQVLITGRDVVVQDSFRDPKPILQVLPYIIHDKEQSTDPYLDAQKLLDEDQRKQWWEKYGKASQKTFSDLPQKLNRDNLTEITAQPLLNYLVALSYVQGKLELSETTNLNTVYNDLLNAVYERGYERKRKHAAIADMTRDQFVRVLEEIALAAWHGDGRTTTVKEIEDHCESSGLKRLLEVFEEGVKAGITRLLAAFYFRQSGVRGNDRTFEFTHKSFSEYLTARRIVRAMKRIHRQLARRREDMEEGWSEREALLHWAQICGPTRIDSYLLSFLEDEVGLKNETKVESWQQTFAHLIGTMLRHGMPMEKVEPPLKFHSMNQWAIHSEEALLLALNSCSRKTQELSVVSWPYANSFIKWQQRLDTRDSSLYRIKADMLQYLDLSHQHMNYANLAGSNLAGASLEEAWMPSANLVNANLDRAILSTAELAGVNLNQASLEDAELDNADLTGANLINANLSAANLDNADLTGANLINAKLMAAHLDGANLTGANLSNAKFIGARLCGADLTGANLINTDLLDADLSKADLSGANLKNTRLDGACLDDTKFTATNYHPGQKTLWE